MEPQAVLARELRGAAHQVLAHREGRARGECDPQHRARARVVVLADQAARVGEDRLLVLAHDVRRQAALALAAAHRAARRVEADPQLAGRVDLGVDEALLALREEVEVVGGGRAARQQQLAEADARGGCDRGRVEVAPHLVELDQPAEERRLLDAWDVARQHLRQVVVGVHEPGKHNLAGRVDAPIDPGPGRNGRRAHGDDDVVLDEDVAARKAAARVVHRRHEARVVDECSHLKNS